MKPIWIVDDDESIRWVLEKALAREDLATKSFENVNQVMEALKSDKPQVLVSDIRMPGESGLELLQSFKSNHPSLPVIVMTAFSDLDSAVSAFQGGAFEYLAKPFDLDKAVELIRRALDESLSESKSDQLTSKNTEILGQAAAMQDVFRAIGRLSQSNVTVLITGESGTGKELVARAVHKHSPRASDPLIALNTAAIPKDLLESELFGHEKGAFTGAQAMRRGRFEQAEGGTLFLDEIGDMPLDLQTRLLRVLSDGNFYRVGGLEPIRANVRVIAATNQNLEFRVKEGLFREDLYHRLNVIRLRIPSLRERIEDIPLLTKYFLAQSANQLGVDIKQMSESAMKYLSHLNLPGNVRQLENLCNWITVMAPGQVVEVKDLPSDLLHDSTKLKIKEGINLNDSFEKIKSDDFDKTIQNFKLSKIEKNNWILMLEEEVKKMLSDGKPEIMNFFGKQFESTLIKIALKFTKGRKNDAAIKLGIGRNTITRKIQELKIENQKNDF